jgi:hypothetical protein
MFCVDAVVVSLSVLTLYVATLNCLVMCLVDVTWLMMLLVVYCALWSVALSWTWLRRPLLPCSVIDLGCDPLPLTFCTRGRVGPESVVVFGAVVDSIVLGCKPSYTKSAILSRATYAPSLISKDGCTRLRLVGSIDGHGQTIITHSLIRINLFKIFN